MTDPNITAPVTFTGRDGEKAALHSDYGALVVTAPPGGAALDGDAARDFVIGAAAILAAAERREVARLRELEAEDRERAATEAAGFPVRRLAEGGGRL